MCEGIQLKSYHLVIDDKLSSQLFEGSATVYVSYKSEQRAILVSPNSNAWFPKLHKTKECMLKAKDLLGTKSVAIHEFIIDHDLANEDRTLEFEVNRSKRFLKIEMSCEGVE